MSTKYFVEIKYEVLWVDAAEMVQVSAEKQVLQISKSNTKTVSV